MNSTSSPQRRHTLLETAFGRTLLPYLEDTDIIEIMVNPDGKLWVDSFSKGKYFTDICLDIHTVANIIKLVSAHHKSVVDENHPEVACDLAISGARFQGWLPPVAKHPTFTIRKRATRIFTLDDYVKTNSLSSQQASLLKDAIQQKQNILIAGSTASGKTTFINALLHELKNSSERVIVLEDLPEIQVAMQDHVILRTTPTQSMRDLVKGVLRMRPDRIIIGEVRDGAALELLKAWNTGHPGGLCTIHANSPFSVISRLEDLIQEVVMQVPHRLIEEAIDLVIFMKREKEGRYKIDSIHHYDELLS